MRLKLTYHYFLILLLFGCQNQSNQYIIEFEKILGERKTEVINILVSDFEDNLEKIYPDLSLQKAYEQYLKDLINPKETNWEKFKFQSDKTYNEFVNSGLKDEIYTKELQYNEEKNDSLIIYNVNQTGKYMQALYEIKDHDSLVYKYWNKREIAGMMQNELVVNGILYYKPDFNNYFHKRIVVLEYSY